MAHIHPHYNEPESIDHRTTISNNWETDDYGLVHHQFAVECMFRHGTTAFMDVLSTKRPFVHICKYPDEVQLMDEE